ncbi:MAG: enoyl-CoA hydratase [Enterovirga sp.]|nr:enoyl-CoA hydratase [Enterovirga sp.]
MSGPEGGTITRDTDGPVTVLTIRYPERRNALSMPIRAMLADSVAQAMNDAACRAIVLTGAGGQFCSGGDISGMDGLDAITSRGRLVEAHRLVRLLVEGEKPVIAAVEGHAAGAGLSLAAACDIVVAARDATFTCSFNRIGLVPDLGAAWLLPQRLGHMRARQIMLTGEPFGAAEAERWGFVAELTEPGAALTRAIAAARRIGDTAAPLSNAYTKRLLARQPASLAEILKAEEDAQSILFSSRDFDEGRSAFREKRKPGFEGR